MRTLLIGCGHTVCKRIQLDDDNGWHGLVTLDINEDCNPDVVHNLEDIPLPFPDNEFDEIHAYNVLEHIGRQGDYRFFFNQFYDFWRILKPGGKFFIIVPTPTSKWAYGDPGHTRVLPIEAFCFLSQKIYDQLGETSITDYRQFYKGDFVIIYKEINEDNLALVLEAIKGVV